MAESVFCVVRIAPVLIGIPRWVRKATRQDACVMVPLVTPALMMTKPILVEGEVDRCHPRLKVVWEALFEPAGSNFLVKVLFVGVRHHSSVRVKPKLNPMRHGLGKV